MCAHTYNMEVRLNSSTTKRPCAHETTDDFRRKKKSADFYLPSRGYRELFTNEFVLLQLKYGAANFFRLIAAKLGRKQAPQKTVQKSLSQRKIMRELHSDEKKGL